MMKYVQPEAPSLNRHEVAARLGVHTNTVRRIPPAELPYFVLSKRGDRRYRPTDVQAYLQSKRVGR